MPTLAELTAQQAELTKQMAKAELPMHEEAAEALSDLAKSDVVARLAEIAAELPASGAKNALANVSAAINAASGLISMHLPKLRELAGVASAATLSSLTPSIPSGVVTTPTSNIMPQEDAA